MDHIELRAAIETLWPGHGGQSEAARQFGIKLDTMRAYLAPPEASRSRSVPEWLARDIAALMAQFPGGMRQSDPRQTIAILHGHMVGAGWTDPQSAAAILGAALVNARNYIGEDELRGLLALRQKIVGGAE